MLTDSKLMQVIECIASGLTVSQTRDAIAWPLAADDCEVAYKEAKAQGIEDEDMAPSWRDFR
jgi:hypothetical protein